MRNGRNHLRNVLCNINSLIRPFWGANLTIYAQKSKFGWKIGKFQRISQWAIYFKGLRIEHGIFHYLRNEQGNFTQLDLDFINNQYNSPGQILPTDTMGGGREPGNVEANGAELMSMLQNHPTNTYYLTTPKTSRLSRMSQKYDLNEGRLICRCIVRKWMFCQHVKNLAEGHKLNSNLLHARALKDVPPTSPMMNGEGGANKVWDGLQPWGITVGIDTCGGGELTNPAKI